MLTEVVMVEALQVKMALRFVVFQETEVRNPLVALVGLMVHRVH